MERNAGFFEDSLGNERVDVVLIEREARRVRAEYLAGLARRVVERLRTAIRGLRARSSLPAAG